MTKLTDVVDKVRTKNAGPFWLTIDIFCGSADRFSKVRNKLSTEMIARAFQTKAEAIKRFELADLDVIKFSLPRPYTQGIVADRDMHGASYAILVDEIELDDPGTG